MSDIDLNELIDNPEGSGFTKIFRCDRCQRTMHCAPDFDPPGCMECNPELWSTLPGGPE